jgi:hypothetical protein
MGCTSLHVLGHGGAEHEGLFGCWQFCQYFLYLQVHVYISEYLVALVYHKEVAVLQLDKFAFAQVVQTARGRDYYVRGFRSIR